MWRCFRSRRCWCRRLSTTGLAPGGPRFKPELPVIKLEGDRDVFGDGSITLLATPWLYARPSIAAGQVAKDWRRAAVRATPPTSRKTGTTAAFRRRIFNKADQRFDAAPRRHPGQGEGSVLEDQSRQGAARWKSCRPIFTSESGVITWRNDISPDGSITKARRSSALFPSVGLRSGVKQPPYLLCFLGEDHDGALLGAVTLEDPRFDAQSADPRNPANADGSIPSA